jgi:Predicted DNA-binding proteins
MIVSKEQFIYIIIHVSSDEMPNGRRRGVRRRVGRMPDAFFYKPDGTTKDSGSVELTINELEAIRLIDLEGLNQEDAAYMMGVSRRTFWNDLKSARRKVAEALVKGKAIEIKGGSYVFDGDV